MNESVKLILFFINGILYLGIIPLWLAIPEEKTLNYSLTIFNLSLTSILMYQKREDIKIANKKFVSRKWSYAVLNLILVSVIIAFLNYLSFKNAMQLDLSEGKINSLTDSSVNAIKGLKSDLDVTVFARKPKSSEIVTVLDLYRYHKKNMNIDVVDPGVRPDMVKKYDVKKENTVVMEYEKKREYIEENSELAYSNALIKLGREKDPYIIFTEGHEELSFDEKGESGGSALFKALQKARFNVERMDLISEGKVPEHADGLVIWGPKTAFHKQEIKAVDEFLRKGGSLLLALDPSFNEDKLVELRNYFKKVWEIDITNSLVVDRSSHVDGSKGTVPLTKKFDEKHPITLGFTGQVFFPLTSAVRRAAFELEKGRMDYLTFTAEFPSSWEDVTPMEIISGEMIYNGGEDRKGPIPLAAAWEEVRVSNDKDKGEEQKRTRIVAFGNSTFVANPYELLGSNYKFFIKSLTWISDDDQLSSFNLPIKSNDPIFITSSQLKIVFYLSVILGPIVLFGFAFIIFRKRRKL